MLTISRIVTLLTPVFAGLAGWLCELAATYLPGAPQLDQSQLTAVFIAGATAAAAAVVKWLDGRSKHEQQLAELAARQHNEPEDLANRIKTLEDKLNKPAPARRPHRKTAAAAPPPS